MCEVIHVGNDVILGQGVFVIFVLPMEWCAFFKSKYVKTHVSETHGKCFFEVLLVAFYGLMWDPHHQVYRDLFEVKP
jgi:hypothetical protein